MGETPSDFFFGEIKEIRFGDTEIKHNHSWHQVLWLQPHWTGERYMTIGQLDPFFEASPHLSD